MPFLITREASSGAVLDERGDGLVVVAGTDLCGPGGTVAGLAEELAILEYGRVITSAAFSDMATTGNLPETFVGSFAFSFEVEDVAGSSASPGVTEVNSTTIDSATRFPKADGWYFELV